MIVDRRWPAWNGFAMLTEENSMRAFFPAPEWFLPKLVPFDRILGIVIWASSVGLKKNWINCPAATGGRMYLFSGNYSS